MSTTLEVVGKHPETGSEDADGVQYYNDIVMAGEHGILGKLQVEHLTSDFATILRADDLVLIKRGFPDAWTDSPAGASIHQSPFGFFEFDLQADNGSVRYRLLDDELTWKEPAHEDPDVAAALQESVATFQLAKLLRADWFSVIDAPADERREVTTKDLKLVSEIPADAKPIQL